MTAVRASAEYRAIAAAYGARTARRSGVPLIRHVHEGIAILDAIGATEAAQRAFCLHPLVQDDAALATSFAELAATIDAATLGLALEYRHIANATLSHRAIACAADIPLSPLPDVNAMLVADKVQNRKDFIAHHRGRHARSDELDRYFALWLERLDITEERYAELAAIADSVA